MSKNYSIVAIFSEFLTRYQRHFSMLFLLLQVPPVYPRIFKLMLIASLTGAG
jgi:hypothetical protein